MNDNNYTNNAGTNMHISMSDMTVKAKIRNKIIAFIAIICLFSFFSISITSYLFMRTMANYLEEITGSLGEETSKGAGGALTRQAEHFLQIIVREQAQDCDRLLNTIKFDVELIAGFVEDIFNNPQLYDHSRPVIAASDSVDGIYNSVYSLPGSVPMTPQLEQELHLLSNLSLLFPTMTDNPEIIDLYVGMESGLFYNYTSHIYDYPDYDPRKRPWYKAAVDNPGSVVFTDIYEDAFDTSMVLTAAKAVYDDSGNLIAVAGLDILLGNLADIIYETPITQSGYAFILDSNGEYVVHPDMSKEGFISNALESCVNEDILNGYERMMSGESGFIEAQGENGCSYMAFNPISSVNWSVGIILYEEELLVELNTLSSHMNELTYQAKKDVSIMTEQAGFRFIFIFAIITLLVVISAIILTHIVSKPLQRLTYEVVKVGEGDFKYRIPVKSHDEIGFLTTAFNRMADNLYDYAQNIIALNQEKTALETISNTDTLTGIFNRRRFFDIAEKQIDNAAEMDKPAFVVMFDLDHFKRINDTYGHQAGDAVIIEISKRVRGLIRSNDLFARYGGEEFILTFTEISKTGIHKLVERIRSNISKTPVEYEGIQIHITASFGIAPIRVDTGLKAAITLADEALYKAKNQGRNRVVSSFSK